LEAYAYDAPPPWEVVQLEIIEQTHWPIEYVDQLDSKWLANRNAVLAARAQAQKIINSRRGK
jgi:hypothetical protein